MTQVFPKCLLSFTVWVPVRVPPLDHAPDEPVEVVALRNASATELVLEGLHLSKRLNKEGVGGRATYRGR